VALEWGCGTVKWDGSRGRLLKFLGEADELTKITGAKFCQALPSSASSASSASAVTLPISINYDLLNDDVVVIVFGPT